MQCVGSSISAVLIVKDLFWGGEGGRRFLREALSRTTDLVLGLDLPLR